MFKFTKKSNVLTSRDELRHNFIAHYVLRAVNGNAVLSERQLDNLHNAASYMANKIYPPEEE